MKTYRSGTGSVSMNQKTKTIIKLCNMKKSKKMGIWMDHSRAILMEVANDKIITNYVESDATKPEKDFNVNKSEKLIHTKENHLQSEYYKKLGGIMVNFSEVIIFGPTEAKRELFNILRADHLFNDTRIDLVDSDKLSEVQMQEFVMKHFNQY
jgi:hypothetical protein